MRFSSRTTDGLRWVREPSVREEADRVHKFYSAYSRLPIGAIGPMADTTTIEILEDQADALHDLKERGDSFKDVLGRLLEQHAAGDEPGQAVPEQLAEAVDLPGPPEREQDALAAIEAARALIEERGAATKKEIVRSVHPEHPVGYDVEAALEKIEAGDRYRGAWWRRVVKPGLEELPGVDAPAIGGSDWRHSPT